MSLCTWLRYIRNCLYLNVTTVRKKSFKKRVGWKIGWIEIWERCFHRMIKFPYKKFLYVQICTYIWYYECFFVVSQPERWKIASFTIPLSECLFLESRLFSIFRKDCGTVHSWPDGILKFDDTHLTTSQIFKTYTHQINRKSQKGKIYSRLLQRLKKKKAIQRLEPIVVVFDHILKEIFQNSIWLIHTSKI